MNEAEIGNVYQLIVWKREGSMGNCTSGVGGRKNASEILTESEKNIKAMSVLQQKINKQEKLLNPELYLSDDKREQVQMNVNKDRIALDYLQEKQNLLQKEYKAAKEREEERQAIKRRKKIKIQRST